MTDLTIADVRPCLPPAKCGRTNFPEGDALGAFPRPQDRGGILYWESWGCLFGDLIGAISLFAALWFALIAGWVL